MCTYTTKHFIKRWVGFLTFTSFFFLMIFVLYFKKNSLDFLLYSNFIRIQTIENNQNSNLKLQYKRIGIYIGQEEVKKKIIIDDRNLIRSVVMIVDFYLCSYQVISVGVFSELDCFTQFVYIRAKYMYLSFHDLSLMLNSA